MRGVEPSQTAIVSAAFRAAHAHVYAGPAIHDDTFALRFSGFEDAEQLRRGFEATGIPALPEASAYFALRHRFSEELLDAAVKDGVRQIVLLGAGLDSFALRHPDIVRELDFFEVDHPNTQSWKLERINVLGLAKPDINYLTIDFQKHALKDVLSSGGVDFAQQIFFSWLGVTQYIEKADVTRTLGLVTGAGSGSQIVFDFIVAPDELDEHARQINTTYAAASASRGEPWITSYSPEALIRELKGAGFKNVERLTPEEAGRRYYRDQPVDVVPMQGWQLVHAAT
jgi:methyltransferase (TIGR00027 family)